MLFPTIPIIAPRPQTGAAAGRAIAGIIALVLAGCASAPFERSVGEPDLRAEAVRAQPEAHSGSEVIWGGRLARLDNLAERTRLEIIGYPLERRTQRPRFDEPPGTRFRVYQAGYLEAAEFEVGRAVTVRGRVAGTERGSIGEADYRFPVLESPQFHLWPRDKPRADGGPRVNFGFGVIFGR